MIVSKDYLNPELQDILDEYHDCKRQLEDCSFFLDEILKVLQSIEQKIDCIIKED